MSPVQAGTQTDQRNRAVRAKLARIARDHTLGKNKWRREDVTFLLELIARLSEIIVELQGDVTGADSEEPDVELEAPEE